MTTDQKTTVLLVKGLLARSCLDRVLRTLTRNDAADSGERVRQAVADIEHIIEKISKDDAWILGN